MYKFSLKDDESQAIIKDRTQGRPAAERTGFVGVVEFHRGPRGGRYRSLRTPVLLDFEAAIDAVEKLAAREWKPAPRGTDVFEITCQGEVIA